MKAKALGGLALTWAVSGCLAMSLHPHYVDDDLDHDRGLAGTWEVPGEEGALVITDEGDSYRVDVDTEEGPVRLSAVRFVVDGQAFLDVIADPEGDALGPYEGFLLPAHLLVRVERDGDRLAVALLEPDEVQRLLESAGSTPWTELDDNLVITAPSAEVRGWVGRWSGNPDAWGEPGVMQRRR